MDYVRLIPCLLWLAAGGNKRATTVSRIVLPPSIEGQLETYHAEGSCCGDWKVDMDGIFCEFRVGLVWLLTPCFMIGPYFCESWWIREAQLEFS